VQARSRRKRLATTFLKPGGLGYHASGQAGLLERPARDVTETTARELEVKPLAVLGEHVDPACLDVVWRSDVRAAYGQLFDLPAQVLSFPSAKKPCHVA
jgi:hypothetical protein